MDNRNNMAQLRYLEEAAVRLTREGFDTGQIEDHHLPVSWNGNYLCRISGTGSVLYHQRNVENNGVQTKLQEVINIAKLTSEYMTILERAPQLQVNGLEGDYRILADFGDIVLAGHPTERGVQFVTWEWDWDRKGVHQGNYFQENYEAAKHDFAVRSGLVFKDALFEPEQLVEICHALSFVREQDDSLSIGRDQGLEKLMEQVSRLLPEDILCQRDAPEQNGMTMQ